jgi:hypothetical protein
VCVCVISTLSNYLFLFFKRLISIHIMYFTGRAFFSILFNTRYLSFNFFFNARYLTFNIFFLLLSGFVLLLAYLLFRSFWLTIPST